jgi:hypothetical protein
MPETSGIRIDGQRQYLHQKNLKLSLALLARSIDYRKNGSTRHLLFYRRPCDEKHGAPS